MSDGRITGTVKIESQRFFNKDSNFGIIIVSPIEMEKGEPILDKYGTFILKGTMPQPRLGGKYSVSAYEMNDPKWGMQYVITSMYSNLALSEDDYEGQRTFLNTIFTELQVNNMYEALENPYLAFTNGEVDKLVTVKGCGLKVARRWIKKFNDNLNVSRIFSALREYELTSNMVKKLLEYYQSPDIVIERVKNNPYCLIDIKGVGWKKCDEIALKSGMDFYSNERVEAFIKYYLKTKAEEGFTYVYANSQLMESILEFFGNDIPDEPINVALKNLNNKLWISEDHQKIGLKYYADLEYKIANKLIELRNAKNTFEYDDWKQIIQEQEEEQGWKYTEQQLKAIQASLDNNVVIITGYAGCGKSSIVSGVLKILHKYSFAQCALAGRAAARLAEVTHQEGYTIHRLLGFPLGEEEHGLFGFHEDNPLLQDIIILDEISMVDGELFYRLLQAIAPGTKLILLGDVGQLESIGCSNIAHDLINSPQITSVQLDKIHRQAESSAIITDSLAVRHNQQVLEKDFVGEITKGELQDLTYDCYSDKDNTFFKVMQHFSKALTQCDSILDIQIMTPMKEGNAGIWNLNNAVQELYNPEATGKDEITIFYDKSHTGVLRVGDKVMCVNNHYKTELYDGQWERLEDEDDERKKNITPIYNGNIGIITKINKSKFEIVVDFVGIGEVLIERKMLSSIYLGYACTVHKCQGSQFPYVIFGLDYSAFILLTKEMVYTAITRASKHCTVVTQTAALRYAINTNGVSEKQTILIEALSECGKPKLTI